MVSRYQLHVNKWKDCTDCDLHECRHNTVFARGKIPCDVLLCGESPGASEDSLGIPFIGPAGKLLDGILDEAFGNSIRCALTNIVCCIPLDTEGNKVEIPHADAIRACSIRLKEFIEIARPKLIVGVGAVAASALKKYRAQLDIESIQTVEITHPAALLPGRINLAQQGLMIKRCVVVLSNAVQQLCDQGVIKPSH